MAQARWLIISFLGLVLGTSYLFRLAHPTDAAISDAKWSLRLGRIDPVVGRIDQIAQAIDSRPDACVDLAWKLVALHRPAAAARLLESARQSNPFDRKVAEALLAVDLYEKDLSMASELLEKISDQGLPLSREGRKMQVSCLVQTKNFPEAEKALQQIILDDPKDVNAIIQLGNVYDAQHCFAEAATEFRSARAIRADDPQIGLALARALTWDAMQAAQRTTQPANAIAHD